MLTVLAAATSCNIRWDRKSHDKVRNNMAYNGIDVSSHQQDIDWVKVAGDTCISFVYIKATEGETYFSPHYSTNLKAARQQHIAVGSYHYLTTTASVNNQFANFCRNARRDNQDLIPMLDVEDRGTWSRSQFIDSVGKMLQLMERHYHCRPMIYSTVEFYNENLAANFNDYPLYIGRYSNSRPRIYWSGKYTIWQFTENGIVTGIPQFVDLAKFNDGVTLDDIRIKSRN